MSLNAEERAVLSRSAEGTIIDSAVARLYEGQGSSWQYNNVMGAVTLLESEGSHYICVYDLNNGTSLFEQELYHHFEYNSPRPFFHVFEGDENVYGLSFADESEASKFHQNVTKAAGTSSSHGTPPHVPSHGAPPQVPSHSPSHGAPPQVPSHAQAHSGGAPPPIPSHSPATPAKPALPAQPAQPAARQPAAHPASHPNGSPAPKRAAQKRKKRGFFGKAFSMVKEGLGMEEEQQQDISITVHHETFKHESHIGWDPANGFEIRNIPPQWRKLFQAAGVKKNELRDADTAKFIMDTVAEAAVGVNPMAAAAPTPAGGPPAPSGGPPPPTGGPPPPTGGGPPAPGGGPPPSGGGAAAGGGGLFAGLNSVKLNAAADRAIPDLDQLNDEQSSSLANHLAKALEMRREVLDDDDEDDSDSEWSD
eukprot:TRINITY_DN3762_c0_g2_i3.p1 TRINITY_DN3762_c0_g2~~TRINITY_DN3762_c0_g2_i3.p1  ORF type:complete len:421 (+),score=99.30 TRINITY_DN3762_c0_g2_i3:86-1348(+)